MRWRGSIPPGDPRGFVHYENELMLVVAIIGILAAIAIPKFAELIRKSNEGSSKGALGVVRASLSQFYGDFKGLYPRHPAALLVDGRYLVSFPKAKAPNYHLDSSEIHLAGDLAEVTDRGGWLYVPSPASADWGSITVNCTHTDSKGTRWNEY